MNQLEKFEQEKIELQEKLDQYYQMLSEYQKEIEELDKQQPVDLKARKELVFKVDRLMEWKQPIEERIREINEKLVAQMKDEEDLVRTYEEEEPEEIEEELFVPGAKKEEPEEETEEEIIEPKRKKTNKKKPTITPVPNTSIPNTPIIPVVGPSEQIKNTVTYTSDDPSIPVNWNVETEDYSKQSTPYKTTPYVEQKVEANPERTSEFKGQQQIFEEDKQRRREEIKQEQTLGNYVIANEEIKQESTFPASSQTIKASDISQLNIQKANEMPQLNMQKTSEHVINIEENGNSGRIKAKEIVKNGLAGFNIGTFNTSGQKQEETKDPINPTMTGNLTTDRAAVAVGQTGKSIAQKVGNLFVSEVKQEVNNDEVIRTGSNIMVAANALGMGIRAQKKTIDGTMIKYGLDKETLNKKLDNIHRLSDGKSISQLSVIDLKEKVKDINISAADKEKLKEAIETRKMLNLSSMDRINMKLRECGRFGKMSSSELSSLIKSGKLTEHDLTLAKTANALKLQQKKIGKLAKGKGKRNTARRRLITSKLHGDDFVDGVSFVSETIYYSRKIIHAGTRIVSSGARIALNTTKKVAKVTKIDALAKYGTHKILHSAPAQKTTKLLHTVNDSKIVKTSKRVAGAPKRAIGHTKTAINKTKKAISNNKLVRAGKKIGGKLKTILNIFTAPVDFIMNVGSWLKGKAFLLILCIGMYIVNFASGILFLSTPMFYIFEDSKSGYTVSQMVKILEDKEEKMWEDINNHEAGMTKSKGYDGHTINKYTKTYYNYKDGKGNTAYLTDNSKAIISMTAVHFEQDFTDKDAVKKYLEDMFDLTHKVTYKDSSVYACSNGDLCEKTYGSYSTRKFDCSKIGNYDNCRGFQKAASNNDNYYITTRNKLYNTQGIKGGCVKDKIKSGEYNYLPQNCYEYTAYTKKYVEGRYAFTPKETTIIYPYVCLIKDADLYKVYPCDANGNISAKDPVETIQDWEDFDECMKEENIDKPVFTYDSEIKKYVHEIVKYKTVYDCVFYKCNGNHKENICHGHTDLTVDIQIYGLEDAYKLDKTTTWDDGNKEWANALYEQDWYELYGVSLSSGTVGTTLSDAELNGILENLPVTTSTDRKRVVNVALSAVGKCPYVYGGTASSSGVSALSKGLDCSHFVDWVYWNAMNNNLGNGNTSTLWNKSTAIKHDELEPGDIAFLADPKTGVENHVGIYVGKNSKGKDLWVHCNAAAKNVSVNTVSYWNYYRRLNIMK